MDTRTTDKPIYPNVKVVCRHEEYSVTTDVWSYVRVKDTYGEWRVLLCRVSCAADKESDSVEGAILDLTQMAYRAQIEPWKDKEYSHAGVDEFQGDEKERLSIISDGY